MTAKEYWLAKDPERLADDLASRHKDLTRWYTKPLIDTVIRNYRIYYSCIIDPDQWETSLQFGGDQGELVKMQIPEARSLIRQLVSIICKKKLSFNCLAETSEMDVIRAVRLGNQLSSHVVNEQQLDILSERAFERSLVQGQSFLKSTWRTDKGRPYIADEFGVKYDGDVEITMHSLIDVLYDTSIEKWKDISWCEVKTMKNRWDLIAQFPDLKDEILKISSEHPNTLSYYRDYYEEKDDDLIPVYELYVRPSPALPKGRMMMYSTKDTIYYDGNNVYGTIPVEPMICEWVDGVGVGYPFFSNLLPAQEMLDHSFSAIATNQSAFAVQDVTVPRGAGISVQEIGGRNFISFTPMANVPGGGRPEALQLTQTAPETFKFIELLSNKLMSLSNINGALRGSPPPGVTSGVAIATLATNALEFLDSAAKAYNNCLENIMEHSINAYQKFATIPHKITSQGKNGKSLTMDFTGEDIAPIKKVKITLANPLMQTMAGRTDIAEKLATSGMIKNIQQYISVLDGAPLDSLYKTELGENDLIEEENESFINGEPVKALSSDDHPMHIREHGALLNDPKVRFNGQMVGAILKHMMEHYKLETETDPVFKAMIRMGKAPEGVPQQAQQQSPKQLPPIPGEAGVQSAIPNQDLAQPAKDLMGEVG